MTRQRIIAISAILLVLALAGYLLLALFGGTGEDRDGWKGYHLLLIPEEWAAGHNYSAVLEQSGLGSVLSMDNAGVTITDFGKGSTIPLLDLDSYFYPGDPRKDPFLSVVTGLFSQGGYRVYYLKTDIPAALVQRKLPELLAGVPGWSFPSGQNESRLPSLILFLACAAIHFFLSGRSRLGLVLSLLPGPAILLAGAGYPVMAGFVIVVSAGLLVPAGRIKLLDRGNITVAAGMLAGSLLLLRGSGPLSAPVLLAALLSALSTGWLSGDRGPRKAPVRTHGKPEHPLFEPVYLGGKPPRTGAGGGWFLSSVPSGGGAFSLPLLLLLAVLLPFAFNKALDTPPYPVPSGSGGGFSLEAVSNAWMGDPEPELPGASGYLAHRFYQDYLLYGVDWGFPFIKKSVSISTFSESGGRITKASRDVEIAPLGDWYGYIQELKKDPLFELFHRQGGASAIRIADRSAGSRSEFRWWDYVCFIVLILSAGVPVFFQFFFSKRIKLQERYVAEWRKS
jgi:hypothetical protein